MTEIQREEILNLLREELRIDVDTKSVYTGGMDGSGELYRNCHTVKILLGNEVITEAYLD